MNLRAGGGNGLRLRLGGLCVEIGGEGLRRLAVWYRVYYK